MQGIYIKIDLHNVQKFTKDPYRSFICISNAKFFLEILEFMDGNLNSCYDLQVTLPRCALIKKYI